jgi:hypothetical protein
VLFRINDVVAAGRQGQTAIGVEQAIICTPKSTANKNVVVGAAAYGSGKYWPLWVALLAPRQIDNAVAAGAARGRVESRAIRLAGEYPSNKAAEVATGCSSQISAIT